MAYIGRQLVRGTNRVLDDISGSFNGSTTTFNLTVDSSASPPGSQNQLWISIGGVFQEPGTDFTVADAQITFTTAPASTLGFWGMIQGDVTDGVAPSDASVSPAKIASTGDFAFPADVRFKDADGSHYVGLQAPTTVSSNLVWTLPAADGSANQLLKTNGSGVLGWATDSATDSTKMPLAGGTFTGDVTFDGATAGRDIVWDRSADNLTFADNAKAVFGTGGDLSVYADGSNSKIVHSGDGALVIEAAGTDEELHLQATDDVHIKVKGSENAIRCLGDAAVELYHNNVKKFETLSNGVRAQGGILFGSDTATANLLYDYEEGTWTPTWYGSSSGSGTTFSTSSNYATYVKIGKIIHVRAWAVFTNKNSATGNFYMGGLPFSNNGSYNVTSNIRIDNYASGGDYNGEHATVYFADGSTVTYWQHQDDDGTVMNIDVDDINANANIMFNATYEDWA